MVHDLHIYIYTNTQKLNTGWKIHLGFIHKNPMEEFTNSVPVVNTRRSTVLFFHGSRCFESVSASKH